MSPYPVPAVAGMTIFGSEAEMSKTVEVTLPVGH